MDTVQSTRPWVDWSANERDAQRRAIAARTRLAPRSTVLILGALFVGAWLVLPAVLAGFALKLYVYVGIAAIGAIGLNLLAGNAGQISLGHPCFIGVGVYCGAVLGGDWGWPLLVWLPAAAVLGALLGAMVGPFALRLKGNYLVMITIALVFIGQHVFNNWSAVTGGVGGRPIAPSLSLFGWDLNDASTPTLKDQRFAWFVWPLVALCALGVTNILRSRPGRALQAIRDRDLTAEVLGIALARYKVAAFAISGGLAALGGAIYGAYVGFASPTEWNLMLAIQYLAMIVVGGMGSVLGSIIGAVVIVCLPYAVQAGVQALPAATHLISQSPGDGGLLSAFALNQILFGVLIALFLTFAPRGLAALLGSAWRRLPFITRRQQP